MFPTDTIAYLLITMSICDPSSSNTILTNSNPIASGLQSVLVYLIRKSKENTRGKIACI